MDEEIPAAPLRVGQPVFDGWIHRSQTTSRDELRVAYGYICIVRDDQLLVVSTEDDVGKMPWWLRESPGGTVVATV